MKSTEDIVAKYVFFAWYGLAIGIILLLIKSFDFEIILGGSMIFQNTLRIFASEIVHTRAKK